MIGRTDLNLYADPPPDIAIESDLTSSSLDRFAIYAGLGVPELWRVSNQYVQIWLLRGEDYELSETSLAFPFLTEAALNEYLSLGLTEGERKAARAFRAWIREPLPAA
jgi:Uma2 family endonuclease